MRSVYKNFDLAVELNKLREKKLNTNKTKHEQNNLQKRHLTVYHFNYDYLYYSLVLRLKTCIIV